MVVGVVCQEQLFRQALESLLSTQAWLQVVPSPDSVRAALSHFAKQTPDVIVLVEEGLDDEEWAMFSALKTLTGVKGVVLTKIGSSSPKAESLGDALCRREDGAPELFHRVREVGRQSPLRRSMVAEMGSRYGQKPRLTQRESEVANLIAQGLPNRRIAQIMGLQEQSVKNLVSIVMRKLGCENRVQVALTLSGASKGSDASTSSPEE